MKKIVSLLIILVAFTSCESDIKFNDPGFQGKKDNFLWRSDLTIASVSAVDNTVTITAYRGLEIITLLFPIPAVGVSVSNPQTYVLGTSDSQIASYSYTEDGVALEYATGMDMGNGKIIINQFDSKTISGNFNFNATYLGESSLVPVNLNFQDGVFYRVPLQ